MADIKKVIEGFEHCIPDPKKPLEERMEENECRHETCPYGPYGNHDGEGLGCFWDLMSDALELLKEQQAEIEQLRNDANARRCKDCRKHGDIDCPLWTDAVEWETDDDWFCADFDPSDEAVLDAFAEDG